jgi:hypothetical protein
VLDPSFALLTPGDASADPVGTNGRTSTRARSQDGDASTLQAHLAKGERRPPNTLWRANPREQGLLGLTDAIAWFGAHG